MIRSMTKLQRKEYAAELAAMWQRINDLRHEKLTIWLSQRDQNARELASDLDLYQREIEREQAELAQIDAEV